MGLKWSNFRIEELNLTLPEAYAVVKNLTVNGDRGTAIIAIQQSRELALNKKAFIEVPVKFTVDRNENPYETAYKIAKRNKKELVKNQATGRSEIVEVPSLFSDWKDDDIYSK